MNTVQRIAKNAAVLLAAQVIGYLLSFFYAMYCARYLGPSSYGILYFAIAFIALFSFLADCGLQLLTIREVSRDKSLAPKYIINTTIIKMILAVIFFGFTSLVVNAMSYPEDTVKVVYLLALNAVFISFGQVFYAVYQSFERMEYLALLQVLNAILIFTGVMLAIKYQLGVVGFAWLYSAASFTVLLCNLIIFIYAFARRFPEWITYKVRIDWSFWKRTLRAALPFALTIAISGIFFRIDVTMISTMKGDAAAGYYSAACNMLMMLLIISGTIISSTFPIMARLFVSSRDSLKIVMEKSSNYMFIMGLPVAVGTFLLADRIIHVIYGANFNQSATALKILILSIPLSFTSYSLGQMLSSINREPLRTMSVGIAVVVNVVLNFILIPRYGITGASVASVSAQVLMFLLFFYFVGKNFHWLPLQKIVLKPLIACTAMGALVYFLREESLLLIIPAAVILYFALLFLLKTFDAKDIKMFKDMIKLVSKVLPARPRRI